MTTPSTPGTTPPASSSGPSTAPVTDAHPPWPALSVNALSQPLLAELLAQAAAWQVSAAPGPLGVRLVDAGIAVPGSVAAGLAVARICMGGLGEVALRQGSEGDGWPTWIDVRSSQPVLACLASQYAGWSLSASKADTGGSKFFALGSGPARALAGKETLFAELGYRDQPGPACLVLEVSSAPPEVVVQKVLRDCGLQPAQLTILLTPTTSQAGTTQVVARVLEVALHKAHVLGFPLHRITGGSGTAPLPPPAPDMVDAMGRTNDAILYGARVHLSVDADDDAARELARALPSANSRDYGRPFAEVFRDYEFDFYRVDPNLFAPAEAWVSSLASGRTWRAGALDLPLLRRQWLGVA
jgi:methenyltetrahydromethanopterin cyclohydrolase